MTVPSQKKLIKAIKRFQRESKYTDGRVAQDLALSSSTHLQKILANEVQMRDKTRNRIASLLIQKGGAAAEVLKKETQSHGTFFAEMEAERDKLGMTKSDFVKVIGVSPACYQLWRRGKTVPQERMMQRCRERLTFPNAEPSGENPPPPPPPAPQPRRVMTKTEAVINAFAVVVKAHQGDLSPEQVRQYLQAIKAELQPSN